MKGTSILSGELVALLRSRRPALFCRDDDAGLSNEGLAVLAALCAERDVPFLLGLVPAALDKNAVDLILDFKARHPRTIELHQHGYRHANYGRRKRYEFGPARTPAQQRRDLQAGWSQLRKLFGSEVYPAFSPPWNRLGKETVPILESLGFRVLSRSLPLNTIPAGRLLELPVSVDLYDWKKRRLKEPWRLCLDFRQGLESGQPIGILLHHAVLDQASRNFLGRLLQELQEGAGLEFHTFANLARKFSPND